MHMLVNSSARYARLVACAGAIALTPLLMGADAKWHDLQSPLECESEGVVVEGEARTTSSTAPIDLNAYFATYVDAESSLIGVAHEHGWSKGHLAGLHCKPDCVLGLYPEVDPPNIVEIAPPPASGDRYAYTSKWRIAYECLKPYRPTSSVIHLTLGSAGGSGVTVGGGASPGGSSPAPDHSSMPLDLSTVTTNCPPCQKIVDQLKEVAAENDKAERQGRDIASQIEAAHSRGDDAQADALQPQAAQNSSQQTSLRAWMKFLWATLVDCEKKKCPKEGANMIAPLPGTPPLKSTVAPARGSQQGGEQQSHGTQTQRHP